MNKTTRHYMIYVLIMFFIITGFKMDSLATSNTYPSESTEITSFRAKDELVFNLANLLDSGTQEEIRNIYLIASDFDYLEKIIMKRYEQEKDPVNKKLIALIGYRRNPQSRVWKERFLTAFPKRQKEIQDTTIATKTFERMTYFVDALGQIADKDESALVVLLDLNGRMDPSTEEYLDGVTYKVANNTPVLFLKHLRDLPKDDQNNILYSIGNEVTQKNLDCPLVRTMKKMITRQDKQLYEISAFSLKFLTNYVKESGRF